MADNWEVYSGGDEYRGGFESLEDAIAYVTANIVRPRGSGIFKWRYFLDEHKGTAHFFWLPPVRLMTPAETKAEIGAMGLPWYKRWWKWWQYRKSPIEVYDHSLAQMCNEFPLGYVNYVSISSVERKFARGARQKSIFQPLKQIQNDNDSMSTEHISARIRVAT